MAEFVTLAQTSEMTGNDIDRVIIDEFVVSDFILSTIPFHRAAAVTGGSSLIYGYERVVSVPTAAFRALGSDVTKSTATIEPYTVGCKPISSSFGIDRVLAAAGAGAQVAFQMSQAVKAVRAAFADAVINGDTANDANAFDGLSVALAGSSTEIDGSALNWASVSAQAEAFAVCDALDSLLSEVDGSEGLAILGNKKSLARIKSAARVAGYRESSKTDAGMTVEMYAGVPLVDLGAKNGTNDPVIGNTTDAVSGNVTTDIYVVRFAQDGFHAVSPADGPIVETRLPNRDAETASLTGWVEMVAAVALKATKSAAVLRGVRVA